MSAETLTFLTEILLNFLHTNTHTLSLSPWRNEGATFKICSQKLFPKPFSQQCSLSYKFDADLLPYELNKLQKQNKFSSPKRYPLFRFQNKILQPLHTSVDIGPSIRLSPEYSRAAPYAIRCFTPPPPKTSADKKIIFHF
jgi:hypothetical protein